MIIISRCKWPRSSPVQSFAFSALSDCHGKSQRYPGRIFRDPLARYRLLSIDLVWSCWLVSMEMGEFSAFRRPFLIHIAD